MRAHPGLVSFVALVALGVVLEVIGENVLGTVVLLGTVLVALGAARNRSRDSLYASSDQRLSERNRGTR